MNDEEFDELLRDAAATYRTPPVPPREAMWEAIAAARSGAGVVPIRPGRRAAPWLIGSVAAAAMLMIGIAIGRQSRNTEVATARVASMAPASSSITEPLPTADTSAALEASSAPVRDVASNAMPHPRDPQASRAPHTTARRFATSGAPSRLGAPNSAGNDGFNDETAYRLAVIEHLTRTEVLLTDFRAEARSGNPAKLDAQFAAVSRELLGTTRLLLATRRGEDPVMTRLLQDLEYVLMQLSQYANDGRGVDLDAINQSIDRRNVLPKLRYSIPAGVSASAGT